MFGQDRSNYLEDQSSITINSRKEAIVNTLFDDHQKEWASNLGRTYLSELKDLKREINLTIRPSFFLRLGETIILKSAERAKIDIPCRIVRLQHSKTETNLTLKSLQEEIVTKVGTDLFQTNQSGTAFDPVTDRIFISTRWSRQYGWFETRANSEIIGDYNSIMYDPLPDWPTNMAAANRKLYLKDNTLRASTSWIRLAIKNLDTQIENNIDTFEYQYIDKTNKSTSNLAIIVDDQENIYVGEDLSGQNILRKVVPVSNPSPTNQMTIPGDYIELEPRRFNNSRGHIVNVIGTRALTWYNDGIWGYDNFNDLLVQFRLEDISGTSNKRAIITENVVEVPSDITYVADITRGNNCWYIVGSDGTQRMSGSSLRDVYWVWTVLD